MVKEIVLHSKKFPNLFALVDDEDYDLVNKYRWNPQKAYKKNKNGESSNGIYARAYINGKYVMMHQLLMGTYGKKTMIDHTDRNGLNNQRNNLREATRTENNRNCGKRKTNTSGYKGVCFHSRDKRWVSQLKVNGKTINLGYFIDAISAARAYDIAAKTYYGDFAALNFNDV